MGWGAGTSIMTRLLKELMRTFLKKYPTLITIHFKFGSGKANSSCCPLPPAPCPLRPRTTPFPE